MAPLVIAAALVAGLVGAPVPAAAAPSWPTPEPIDPRVLVLGDSVVLGAHGAINARLVASGWQPVQAAGESFHTYDAGAVVDSVRSAFGQVAVVALGANDGIDPNEFSVWIDDLMSHLQDVRRVFWVNLRQFRDWVPAANATLAAATARWPNLRIIDWDARSTPDPGLVYADGLHLNEWGQIAMADLIGRTLDEDARAPNEHVRFWSEVAATFARATGL